MNLINLPKNVINIADVIAGRVGIEDINLSNAASSPVSPIAQLMHGLFHYKWPCLM
jgi:hypothetical protein